MGQIFCTHTDELKEENGAKRIAKKSGASQRRERCESSEKEDALTKGILLFDSGTGESKVIFVKRNEKGQVVTEEIKALPSFKGVKEEPTREAILQDYVKTLQDAATEKNTDVAFAGMTAWFRDAPEEEKQYCRNFFQTRLPNVKFLELKADEEALYEADAVNYAAEKSGLGVPNMQLAAGGGSANIVYEGAPYNIATGFRAGLGKLMASGLSALDECEKDATDHIDAFVGKNPAFKQPTEGAIIAISACYYAAKGVGIAKEAAVSSEDIVQAFTERKTALIQSVRSGEKNIEDKKVAQEISNMIVQTQVFKRLTHPNSKVFFRRDWKIDGTAFRTTWTSGYFIKEYLNLN